MINYSIVMRSVNANLFEINQAKSRIKAAQATGQTPEQADLDLVATERQNAYAIAQYAYSGRYPFTNSGDIRSVRW